MSEAQPSFCSIGWADMTADDHESLRDFYAAVCGWKPEPVEMGGYQDWAMQSPDGSSATGICARRGPNAEQPPGWIIYILVPDLEASLAACASGGGELVGAVRGDSTQGRFAVIRDPGGSYCALYQPGS